MRMDPDPVPPGEPLGGRYRLGEQVGRGASSVVFRAEDLRLARTVAVKLFRAPDDPAQAARADLEIATLSRLDHPGLVRVLDAGSHAGDRYVVLDLVEGQTLDRRLSAGPLAVPEAVRLVAEVADILAYVHARGVVHRDVKPGNILLDGSGRPRLGDFGVARACDWASSAEPLTATGCIVGTPRYMAPEQVRGEPATGAVDVYALGLVLLESLTGLPEYQGAGLECAVARLYRPPAVPAWLPAEVAALVTAMTLPDPLRRPTAAQVARRFARAMRPGALVPRPAAPIPDTMPVPLPAPVPSPWSSPRPTPARVPVRTPGYRGAAPAGDAAGAPSRRPRFLPGPLPPGVRGRRRAVLVAGAALAVVALPAGQVWDVMTQPTGGSGAASGSVRLHPSGSGRGAVTQPVATSGAGSHPVRRTAGPHQGSDSRPGPGNPAAGPPAAPGRSGEHGHAEPVNGRGNGPGPGNGNGNGNGGANGNGVANGNGNGAGGDEG